MGAAWGRSFRKGRRFRRGGGGGRRGRPRGTKGEVAGGSGKSANGRGFRSNLTEARWGGNAQKGARGGVQGGDVEKTEMRPRRQTIFFGA